MSEFAAPLVRLSGFTPDAGVLRLVPYTLAQRHACLPLAFEGGQLVVALANPEDTNAVRALTTYVGRPLSRRQAIYAELRQAIALAYDQPLEYSPPSLAECFVTLGMLNAAQLERAEEHARTHQIPLTEAARDLRLVTDAQVAEARGWQLNLPHLRLEGFTVPRDLAPLLPTELAVEGNLIPLRWLPNGMLVGTGKPDALEVCRRVADERQTPVFPLLCAFAPWNRLFGEMYLTGHGNGVQYDLVTSKWLIKQRQMSDADLDLARTVATQTRQPLAEILLSKGLVSHDEWLHAQSSALGVPLAPAPRHRIRRGVTTDGLSERVPAGLARALEIVPLAFDPEEDALILGVTNPATGFAEMVQTLVGMKVETRLLDGLDLQARQEELYGTSLLQRAPLKVPTLGELMVILGTIAPSQYREVLDGDEPNDDLLARRLIERELLDETDWAEAVSVQTGVPWLQLDGARFEMEWIARIPAELAQKHQMLPLKGVGKTLWVAVADPCNAAAGLQAMERLTGLRVIPVLGTRSVIAATLNRFYGGAAQQLDEAARRLLSTLVERGVLTHTGAALAAQEATNGTPLDVAIAENSTLPPAATTAALARALYVPVMEIGLREELQPRIDALGQVVMRAVVVDPVDAEAAHLLDFETAMELAALPVTQTDGQLTVAFANPTFQKTREQLSELLGKSIRPVLVLRRELDEAIGRMLGRKNLGTRLLLAGVITRSQLNEALDLAKQSGVRLGHALVNRGYLTAPQLARFLADQAQVPFFQLKGVPLDEGVAGWIDPESERRLGILPLAGDAAAATLAMVDPFQQDALHFAETMLKRRIRPVVVSEEDFEAALERLYGQAYLARSISALLERSPEDSAYRVISRAQKIALILVGVVSLLALLVAPIPFIIVINTLAVLFYLSFSIYKLYLVFRSIAASLEIPTTPEEVAALDERALPMYTIMVPVYHEASVLPDLLRAIARLDYPTTKLDVQVLMEQDDEETVAAFHALNMPSHFQGIVVPNGLPKTKPKACNYGLIHARGEYVVIYDAEDLPEPDQLKRVQIAFNKSAPELVCIQSKLNYYNRNQNWLTAWFTVEYSMWFDLFLPGLVAANAPVPLGGTSNHFKREALVEVGAWDPYNVTEDADLGVRLFKRGYRTGIVDSTTYEEANSELYNWIRQRSRWLKGYILTWLVHMRHPIALYKEIGARGFFGFQMIIGGTFFAALLNPIYWGLTILWFLTQAHLIQQVFPTYVFYAGMFCLLFGNFGFMYMSVAGAMRRGYDDMVIFALLSPIYWLLMSVGAWKGLWQLITKPYFWEKTNHGLNKAQGAAVEPVPGASGS